MATRQTGGNTALYVRREGVIVSTRAWLPDAAGLAALEAMWRPVAPSPAPSERDVPDTQTQP